MVGCGTRKGIACNRSGFILCAMESIATDRIPGPAVTGTSAFGLLNRLMTFALQHRHESQTVTYRKGYQKTLDAAASETVRPLPAYIGGMLILVCTGV